MKYFLTNTTTQFSLKSIHIWKTGPNCMKHGVHSGTRYSKQIHLNPSHLINCEASNICEGVLVDSALVVLYTYGPYRSPIFSNGPTKETGPAHFTKFSGFVGDTTSDILT